MPGLFGSLVAIRGKQLAGQQVGQERERKRRLEDELVKKQDAARDLQTRQLQAELAMQPLKQRQLEQELNTPRAPVRGSDEWAKALETEERIKAKYNPPPKPVPGQNGNPQTLQRVLQLKGQYDSDPSVKSAKEVATAYAKVRASATNPTAAGDMALIYGTMKMWDPGSTVREGEFANAQNATGVPGAIQTAYNRVLRGERLNEAQRKDFVAQAEKAAAAHRQTLRQINSRYAEMAKRHGVDERDVIYDPFEAYGSPADEIIQNRNLIPIPKK